MGQIRDTNSTLLAALFADAGVSTVTSQRAPDDNVNLNLNFANGVQTNRSFGLLPTDNKYGRRIIQMAFKFYF